jgi:hypothetical protein
MCCAFIVVGSLIPGGLLFNKSVSKVENPACNQ